MAYTRTVHAETGALRDDMIRRDSDGAFIPADPLNADWQAYLAWLEAGNAPAAPPAVVAPAVTKA